MFGDGMRRVGWNSDDIDAEFVRDFEVNFVKTCATKGNVACAAFVELMEDVAVEFVINKDADAFKALSENDGVFVEVNFEILDFVIEVRIVFLEKFTIVRLGVE